MSEAQWSSSPLHRVSHVRRLTLNGCETVCAALPLLPARIYDEAMSFSDTVFLFFLALILFGPKKLPEMARQAGRLLAELRRASNEFRSQIETQIAHLEVANSQTAKPTAPTPHVAHA